MKKRYILMIALCTILSLFVSCNGSVGEKLFVVLYKVTFEFDNGATALVKTVKEGEKVSKPSNPTKKGYDFVKWTTDKEGETAYNFEKTVTEDITLYAQWIKVYTVTFNSKGGSDVEPKGVKVEPDKTVAKPDDPTRAGYIFSKWTTDEAGNDEYDFESTVTEDITLYAQWIKVYTVKFNSKGGSAVSEQSVKHGEKATEPTSNPTKDMVIFDKWTTDEDGNSEYDFNTAVTKDITLYAKWRDYVPGDTGPAGGKIFYVNPNYVEDSTDSTKNWKYLEVAKDTLTTLTFSTSNWEGSLGTQTGIGYGKSNTEKIVDKFGRNTTYAAQSCAEYSVEVNGETFDDWFLPSKDELSEMYNVKDKIVTDGATITGSYLSSSEGDTNNAWRVDFSNGATEQYYRTNTYNVRPVRAF